MGAYPMLRVWSCLQNQHDWRLVALAVMLCFLSSLTSISMFQRALATRHRANLAPCLFWLLTAGFVSGCGIWSTHFISMLAYDPGFSLDYDVSMTAASLLAAAIMTTLGFLVAVFAPPRWGGFAGGAIIGGGVAAMHYMGMASLNFIIAWDYDLVATSIVAGIGFGIAAIIIAQRRETLTTVLVSALFMMLMIVTHHFIAMGAIGLVPPLDVVTKTNLSPIALCIAVASVISAVLVACLFGTVLERYTRRRMDEQGLQRDAALDNMMQGLCMFGPDNRLRVWNRRYLEMYGLSDKATKVGNTVDEMFAARTQAGTIFNNLDAYLVRLYNAIADRTPQKWMTSLPDGRAIYVTYQPMPNGGWMATHEDQTERMMNEARIAHMALHDALTDLPNRGAFDRHLDKTLRRAAPTQASFAAICIDLDRFKEINDVYGHVAGDQFLCEVARRLKAVCRAANETQRAADQTPGQVLKKDIGKDVGKDNGNGNGNGNGAFVARFGGDEFIVIVSHGAQPNAAQAMTRQIADAFAPDFVINGARIHASCTIGVSLYPRDGLDAETLIANADAALYRAKGEMRGSIRFFQPALDQSLHDKRVLQEDLKAAIRRQEFELDYQPQATPQGHILGFEVLVRWRHPTRGLISPRVFVPLAEETGLITAIGDWVLREACREAASWANPLSVAVNLSPVDFRTGNISGTILSALWDSGLTASRLHIEITEGIWIEDSNRVIAELRRIKDFGVKVAMDDFGSGYSSLSYLQSLPLDKIKIDNSFVAKLGKMPQSAAIISAIVALGRSLGLVVLAEGVETQEQLEMLAAEGCNEVQGYLIGYPQPVEFYRDVMQGKIQGQAQAQAQGQGQAQAQAQAEDPARGHATREPKAPYPIAS
jgi:predicted signal transduction protein with EAL and GGDEF domain